MESGNPAAITLLDQAEDLDTRLRALALLIEQDPQAAVPVLLRVGERTDEPDPLLIEVGAALAELLWKGIRVTQFDLRDISEVTDKGFTDWMPPK